ncbi:MAG: HEAT repeat domain-containing protein [Candidatus Thorarchaeota archaeon]
MTNDSETPEQEQKVAKYIAAQKFAVDNTKKFLRNNLFPGLIAEFGKDGMDILWDVTPDKQVCGPSDAYLEYLESAAWKFTVWISQAKFDALWKEGPAEKSQLLKEVRSRLKYRITTFFSRYDFDLDILDHPPSPLPHHVLPLLRPFDYTGKVLENWAIHRSEKLEFYILILTGWLADAEKWRRTKRSWSAAIPDRRSLFKETDRFLSRIWHFSNDRHIAMQIHQNPAAWIGQRLQGTVDEFSDWLIGKDIESQVARYLGEAFEPLTREYLRHGTTAYFVADVYKDELIEGEYYSSLHLPIPFLGNEDHAQFLKFIDELVIDPNTWLACLPSECEAKANQWLNQLPPLSRPRRKSLAFNIMEVIGFAHYLKERAKDLATLLNTANKALERRKAINELVTSGDKQSIDTLIKFVDDDIEKVRYAAIRALGEIGGSRAVNVLITALTDEDEGIRRLAAFVLGRLGDKRAVGPLIECLTKGDARFYIADALVEIGELAVVPLAAALQDEDIRESAAAVLVKIGEPAVASLITALQNEDRDVRKKAVEALGTIRDPRAVDPLLVALQDKELFVQKEAAAALVKIGEAAVEPLLAALQNKAVRNYAAKILAKIDDPQAREALQQFQNSA